MTNKGTAKAMATSQRMLGVLRQPFCGKCCGEHNKKGNTTQKRAERRAQKQAVKNNQE